MVNKNNAHNKQTHTPHIAAKKGEIAPTVILPGDPERAEWAAKEFLSGARMVTNLRGIKGFTGKHNGKAVTIIASGMGAPSCGIYVYELFSFYGAQKIIRTGTCAALQKDIEAGELIFAMSASTDSNYAHQYAAPMTFSPCADFSLLKRAVDFADANKIPRRAGMVFSSDFFSAYDRRNAKSGAAWKKAAALGALAQEMETYALYCEASALKKSALSILTTVVNLHKPSAKPKSPSLEKMFLAALSLV